MNKEQNTTPQVVTYKRNKSFLDTLKSKKVLSIIIACILVCLSFGGGMLTQWLIDRSVYSEYDILMQVVDYVKTYYYVDITEEEIIKNACMGAVNYLDPYSTFYEEADTGDDDSGYFGITVAYDVCGLFRVKWVEVDRPADKAGVEIGDYIYKINDTVVQGDFTSIFDGLISNKKVGDSISVSLKKTPDGDIYKTVDLVAENYPQSYVTGINDFTGIPGDTVVPLEVGYIKLSKFNDESAEQFGLAIDAFNQAGKTKLILDLRGNSGGTLKSLESIASYLLKSDTGNGKIPIARFTFKNGVNRTSYTIDEYNYIYKDKNEHKIVVLVDEKSASASELLTGAMLVHGTGEIVGTTTYGKGVAQTIQAFPENKPLFNIKITTSRYTFYSDISNYVSGATSPTYSINGVGFTPVGANFVEKIKGKNTLLEVSQFKRAVELINAF